MRPIKLIVALGLILTTLSIPGALAASEVEQLTLSEAIELAAEGNAGLALNRLAVEKAQISLRQAKSAVDKIEEVTSYEQAKQEELSVPQAESNLKMAEQVLAGSLEQLKYDVTESYFNLSKAFAALELAEENLVRTQAQLQLARARKEAGAATKSAVLEAEVQVAKAEAELLEARQNIQVRTFQFNTILGRDQETAVKLAEVLELKELPEDLAGLLAYAFENKQELIQAREKLSLAEQELNFAGRYWTPNVYTYRLAENAQLEAEKNWEQKRQATELAVRTGYLEAQTSQQQYQMLQKSLNQAEENLELARARYEAGVATNMEVFNAQYSLAQLELQALEALYHYNLVRAKVLLAAGMPIN